MISLAFGHHTGSSGLSARHRWVETPAPTERAPSVFPVCSRTSCMSCKGVCWEACPTIEQYLEAVLFYFFLCFIAVTKPVSKAAEGREGLLWLVAQGYKNILARKAWWPGSHITSAVRKQREEYNLQLASSFMGPSPQDSVPCLQGSFSPQSLENLSLILAGVSKAC